MNVASVINVLTVALASLTAFTATARAENAGTEKRSLVFISYHSNPAAQRIAKYLTPNQVIVSLKNETESNQHAVFGASHITAEFENLWIAHGTAARLTKSEITLASANPRVTRITKMGRVARLVSGNISTPQFANSNFTYGLQKIGIPRLRAEKPDLDGRGVRVGILDTGIDPAHPALKDRVAFFKDFVAGRDATPYDDQGHGTHVAGTIAGSLAQGWVSSEWIGVAPAAELVIAKVFDQNGRFDDRTLLEGMQWMTQPNGDSKNAPRVVSSSWIIEADSKTEDPADEPFCAAVHTWVELGIIPVFSAGNDGPDAKSVGLPAACPEAIAVGASDESDQVADLSSRGPGTWKTKSFPKPELVAPGIDIDSAQANGGGIACKSGTSMAAPHVAGALAVLLQNLPATPSSAAKAKQALLDGAFALGNPRPNSDAGAGRLDVYQSVEILK